MEGPDLPRAPRTLWVLSSPRQTFRELGAPEAPPPRGYSLLFVWLAIELALAYPHVLGGAIATLFTSPGQGLVSLYSSYVRYAIGPAVGMFAAGLLVYYRLRAKGLTPDLWRCTTLVAYAWVPHLVLAALSGLLASLHVDSPLLLHVGYNDPRLTPPIGFLKMAIEYGPTLVLVRLAARVLLERAPPAAVTPRERSRAWAVAGVFALVLITAASSIAHDLRERWDELGPVHRGEALPAFTVHTLDGERVDKRDFAGQVTLIDFWATWCPPCVAAMPALEAVHRDLGPRGLELLSINVEPDNRDNVRRFASERALSFPIYVDHGDVQSRLHVHTLPTTILVDKRGVVRAIHVGNASLPKLRAELEALLAE